MMMSISRFFSVNITICSFCFTGFTVKKKHM